MPFPMVHLSIAKRILDATDHIKKPCQFILGSIAPDPSTSGRISKAI
jgi:hypothetical protein